MWNLFRKPIGSYTNKTHPDVKNREHIVVSTTTFTNTATSLIDAVKKWFQLRGKTVTDCYIVFITNREIVCKIEIEGDEKSVCIHYTIIVTEKSEDHTMSIILHI